MRSRQKLKDTLEQMKMRTQQSKIVGHWESNPKREILRITGYKKKKKPTQQSSNKQSTLKGT